MLETTVRECNVCGREFVDQIELDSHCDLEHAEDPLQDPIHIPGTGNPIEDNVS